jgi:2',3'-cyclic-nucleotide 2'-phosphodiesterase
MNVMMVGDIVGAPGRHALARVVTILKGQGKVDVVIANAENAAGGQGLNPSLAADILSGGADVITLGDHTWDQRDLASYLEKEPRVIRPANFAPACPGRGYTTIDTPHGKVSVMNIIGRVFMKSYDCPFRTADAILRKELAGEKMIFVDMHAEATSEKIALGRYLDGRVSALVGTHTHVQTSDEAILPKGTAYITDLGMTGGKDSVLGRDLESVTSTFLTGMPARFKISEKDVVLEGVIISVDPQTGRAGSIKRVRETA